MNRRAVYALAAWITQVPVEQVADKCGDKAVVICKTDGCDKPASWNNDHCSEHWQRR